MCAIKKQVDVDLPDELGELRRVSAEIENLRFKEGLSPEKKAELEAVSLKLRARERELIVKCGKDIADQIKASSCSLEELSKKIRKRAEKFSKLPGVLDKTTKIILEAMDIVRRVAREI